MADLYSPKRYEIDGPSSGAMKSVNGLVIHHTGGRGNVAGVISTLRDRGLGVTYVMDRDGEVYRVVDEGRMTKHASGYNSKYEGIEVIANNDGDITPEQVEGFRKFSAWHASNYGYTIGPKTVLGHGEISSNKRQTEGATLKWTFLQSEGFDVPADVMVGDKGDGRPDVLFADAPAWVRRPPGNIPDVASEIDVTDRVRQLRGWGEAAPGVRTPMPYSGRLAMLRADVKAQQAARALIESDAAFGVAKPANPTNPDELVMTPGKKYTGTGPNDRALFMDERILSMVAGAESGRAPGLFREGPDMALDGIGGKLVVTASEPARQVRNWSDFAQRMQVPAAPPTLPETLSPPAPAPAPTPPAAPPSDDLVPPTLTREMLDPAPMGTAPRPATPNSRASGRLDEFVASVYRGFPHVPAGDDLEDEDPRGPIAARPATVLPQGTVGRWEIAPTRVANVGTLTAPVVNTSTIFDTTPPAISQSFTGNRAVMALAFDRFTAPPSVAPAKVDQPVAPKLDFKLIDGPEYQAAMRRRDEWVRSRPRAQAVDPAARPSIADQRAEQRRPAVRPPPPSESIVKPLPAPAPLVAPKPAPPTRSIAQDAAIERVRSSPSAKPTTRTIQVANPAYAEWQRRQQVTPPVSAPTARENISGQREEQRRYAEKPAAPAPVVAKPVEPPPPQFIEKRVPVNAPAPATSPGSSALSGGLYIVAPGDTLSAIARRQGTTVAELQRLNPQIANPNMIYAGGKLRLSASANPIAPSAARSTPSPTPSQPSRTAPPRADNSAPAPTGDGNTFKGASTGRQYVVGQIYVNSQGVRKEAMPDGTFRRV